MSGKPKLRIRYIGLFFAAFAVLFMTIGDLAFARRPGAPGRPNLKRSLHHPRGHFVKRIPAGHRVIHFGGLNYFFHGGLFYKAARGGFVVVTAPVGAVVLALPVGFQTILFGGVTYFFINNIFYKRHGDRFIVVKRPPGIVVP